MRTFKVSYTVKGIANTQVFRAATGTDALRQLLKTLNPRDKGFFKFCKLTTV